jgi:carbamoyl-phosphate synthase small subunit
MGVSEAVLVLRDGRVFRGEALGARGEVSGEVIFNTAMTGYQEILTDPSYRGQIVTLTYPLIGNYGCNDEDVESRRPWANGLIVKEASPYPSSWRGRISLDQYLKNHGIVGLQGIDTRALTRHLRDHGSQDGIISSTDLEVERLLQRVQALPQIVGQDLVKHVTVEQPYGWSEGEWRPERGYTTPPPARFKVVAYDAGIKLNILRQLRTAGCDVVVVPAGTPAAGVLEREPDGVFLSNGPGDPEGVPYLVDSVRGLIGRVPIFGICLGHQIIGFAVDPASVAAGGWEPTHVNLNDNTCEGLRHRELPVFCVQYHPEASPGPHDANYLFGRFIDLMASAPRSPHGG